MNSYTNIIWTALASFFQFSAGFCFLYLAQYYLSTRAFANIGELRATMNLLVPLTMFGSQVILVRFANCKSINYFFSFVLKLNSLILCLSLLFGLIFQLDIFMILMSSVAITLYSLMEYRARAKGSVLLSTFIKGPLYFVALNSTIILTITFSRMFHLGDNLEILFSLVTCCSFLLLMLAISKRIVSADDILRVDFKRLTPLLSRGTARIPLAFLRTLFLSLPVLLSSQYLTPQETSNVIVGMMVVRSVAILGNGISPAVIQLFAHPSEQFFNIRFCQITIFFSAASVVLLTTWGLAKLYIANNFGTTSFFYLLLQDNNFLFGGLLLGAFSIYRSILDAKSTVSDVYLVYAALNFMVFLAFTVGVYYNLDLKLSELIVLSILLSNIVIIILLICRTSKIIVILPFFLVVASILVSQRLF